MAENIKKDNVRKLPTQEQQMLYFAQAITDISVRLTNAEVEIRKANANYEILSGWNDLLKNTIELLEKQVEFNEKIKK